VMKQALMQLQMASERAFLASPRLDFIAMAIKGKKIGFDKIIKLIDELVATLKQEQLEDDNKKEYCAAQFDLSDDKNEIGFGKIHFGFGHCYS